LLTSPLPGRNVICTVSAITLTRAFGCIFGAAAFGSTGVSMFSVIGVTAAGFACAGNGNGAAAA
jgi:hypothetical protein